MDTIKTALEEYSGNKLKNNHNLLSFIKIVGSWDIIVGATIYRICTPSFYFNHILTITVVDSIWANELTMKQVVIIKNIKNTTGLEVSSIKTRIGEVLRNEIRVKNREQSNNKVISDLNKKWIDKTLSDANIEDEEIRSMFMNTLRSICLE